MADAFALIDYGAGNLHSVHNALKAAGAERVAVTSDPKIVRGARRIVLPGVGSFKACMEGLSAIPGMVEALEKRVLNDGVPFLGVCVGMQLMATRGLEFGETPGLAWIEGEVVRYTLPAIGALNFVMTGALGGGVTRSLRLDAHGKCLGSAILSLEIPDTEPARDTAAIADDAADGT